MGFRGKYANKRDANEADLVKEFRAHGCSVVHLDLPLDLLVGYRGQTHLVEVKQEGKGLNEKQREFADTWRGEMNVVRSIDDVRDLIAEWGSV